MLVSETGLKPVDPDSKRAIVSLMTRCMREVEGHGLTSYSVDMEYPNVFGAANHNNLWALKSENKIVSALAAYPLTITAGGCPLRAIGIGSVSTHPEHRKRGHSGTLHKEALSFYRDIEGIDFAILWTNLFDYYRTLEYETVGTEVVYVLDKALTISSNGFEIQRFMPEYLNELYSLFREHENCVDRSKEEFLNHLRIPGMEILCAIKNNTPIAYTARGKGSDLKSTVHEWAGDTEALLNLMNENLNREGKKIFVLSSGREKLDRELSMHGVYHHAGNLGMIRILNPESICRKLNPVNFLITENKGRRTMSLHYRNRSIEISIRDASRLFFGPESPDGLLGKEFKELSQILPLPFFVWGLDSV